MLDGISSRAAPSTAAADEALPGVAPPRSIRRRRPLPGSRAVVGAFLVAVAGVGTFAAASGATADVRKPYLVARADLAPGHRIGRDDLAVGRMQLPAYLARGRAFSPAQADRLVGALVLGPIARGELIQAGQLTPPGAPRKSGARQLSFSVDAARAVGGSLVAGEFVDVVATMRSGPDGKTAAVVKGARVVGARKEGGLGGDDVVVTLEVSTPEEAVALAHAVDAGQVTVVRSAPAGR